RRTGNPAPTHCVFAVIATDPAIGTQSVKRQRIDRLPSAPRVEFRCTATPELMPQARASAVDHPLIECRLIARIQEAIMTGYRLDQVTQLALAGIAPQITGPIVMVHDQIE